MTILHFAFPYVQRVKNRKANYARLYENFHLKKFYVRYFDYQKNQLRLSIDIFFAHNFSVSESYSFWAARPNDETLFSK